MTKLILALGIGLLLSMGISVFGPVALEEINYLSDRVNSVEYTTERTPFEQKRKRLIEPSAPFSVVIPKIAAKAEIIEKVDPLLRSSFAPALRQGVAHAIDSALPGRSGRIYLFAQSADGPFSSGGVNPRFYLAGKLEVGDQIEVFYQGQRYRFEIYDKETISPNTADYSRGSESEKTLTLQVGSPPGTTFGYLLLHARQLGRSEDYKVR